MNHIRCIHAVDTVTIRWFSFWLRNSIWKTCERFIDWTVLLRAFCYLAAVQRKHVKWSIKSEIVKCKSSICVASKVIFLSKYNNWIPLQTCTCHAASAQVKQWNDCQLSQRIVHLYTETNYSSFKNKVKMPITKCTREVLFLSHQ